MRKNPCMPCLLLAANPGCKPSRLKNPGDLAELGYLQRYTIERDSDGEHEVHTFGDWSRNGPLLFWSPKLRTLLTFPGKRKGHVRTIPQGMSETEARRLFRDSGVEKAAEIYRKWSIHAPVEIGNIKVTDSLMKPYGRAVDIVYRSAKFNKEGKLEDYIHPFSKSDRIALGASRGRSPSVFAVSGPRLTVTERGIVY